MDVSTTEKPIHQQEKGLVVSNVHEETATASANEMFAQAARVFETAIQAGIKFQEEAVRSLSAVAEAGATPGEWRKRSQAAMEHALEIAQKNVDEAIQAMNENAKTSLDLLEEAFKARQGETAAETQARTREMWEIAVGSLRRNTEVMLQANNRVLESWKEAVRIVSGPSAPDEP